jgi:hypothetical protein
MSNGGKALMPTSSSKFPIHKVKSIASWGGMQKFYRNEFFNFNSKTAQGRS